MSQTVPLRYPIQAHGREVTEITLRRPTVKDLREVERQNLGKQSEYAAMISRLGGIPNSSVDAIDGSDFLRLVEVIDGFLFGFPTTGPSTSSGSPSDTAGAPGTSKT